MKILRATLLPLVTMAAILATPAAQAIPVDYTVSYNGANAGPAFSGTFTFDTDTSRFTNFVWNLGVTPDVLSANSWAAPFFGGTMGKFLFEILTGEDVHPTACGATSRCTFSSNKVTSSSLINSVEFRNVGIGTTEYVFRNAGAEILYAGQLSLSRVVLLVTEPLTLLLMGAGLLGLALARRKARLT